MKRFIYTILLVLPLVANSQNMYNVTGLLENDPVGSARFVGMGGSMGALGGNISVMGTNPAGTAVYRSNDVYISGVMDVVNNNAIFNGTKSSENFKGATLSNLGFVVACDIEGSPVKFVNFGLDYHRKSNIRNCFSMGGNPKGYSQQYAINNLYWKLWDQNYTPFDINNMTSGMYSGFNHNWLALLAADVSVCDKDGYFLVYPDGHEYAGQSVIFPDRVDYYSEQNGGVNVVDFNLSVNIEDRVYLGATLGYYMVDYSRFSCYTETDVLENISYSLENNYRVKGAGVDFKLGAIFRPFKYSPFKVALSVHTPVLYKLADYSSATMYGPYGAEFSTSSKDCYGEDLCIAYSLKTPWRFSTAMAYTFGKYFALNAEYEYAKASSLAFSKRTDIGVCQNEEIACNLKSQHTLRVGAELTIDKVAIRAGYNYISAPFRSSACKYMLNATTTETSTEYWNKYAKNIATVGVGYAAKNLYFDLTYMFQAQNSDFYTYYDMEYPDPGVPVTKVKTYGHSIIAGIGMRF